MEHPIAIAARFRSRAKRPRLLAAASLLLLSASAAAAAPAAEHAGPADGSARVIFLYRSAVSEFMPVNAFFLVDFGGGRAAKVQSQQMLAEESRESAQGVLHFAAAISVPRGVEELKHALVLQGEAGAYLFVPPRTLKPAEEGASADDLRQQLLDRKKNLESWRVQLRVQQESLERLRADAEVIGNLGRIADKADELQRVRLQVKDIDKDMQNVQRLIKLASKHPEPQNFVRRRSALTQQLEELAQAARVMEAGAHQRKAKGEAEINSSLKLVEATRGEDYDALREELAGLRRTRAELEEKYLGGARQNDDYQPQ